MKDKSLIEIFKKLGTYRILKAEIAWQRQNWGKPDAPKQPVSGWVDYMASHVIKAQKALESGDEQGAMEQVRILTAVGVAAMLSNPPKERDAKA